MAQRRHHYERAFEAYLRLKRIPYVAVDEARKALLPESAELTVARAGEGGTSRAIKSFDFVIYAKDRSLLIEAKGRKVTRRVAGPSAVREALARRRTTTVARSGRLESWVTLDDVESMGAWEVLFGAGFEGAFVFIYWCDEEPPDGLFQEIFEYQGKWYALRAVALAEYVAHMRTRSRRWGTVDLPPAKFEAISRPFTVPLETPTGLLEGVP